MKTLIAVILSTLFVSFAQAGTPKNKKHTPTEKPGVSAQKTQSTLATEQDITKIEELVLTTDYKAIAEQDYVTTKKNLTLLLKSTDFSNDVNRRNCARLYYAIMNYRFLAGRPNSKEITKEIQDKNAETLFKQMKNATKEQWESAVTAAFTTDDEKLKAEYASAISGRK